MLTAKALSLFKRHVTQQREKTPLVLYASCTVVLSQAVLWLLFCTSAIHFLGSNSKDSSENSVTNMWGEVFKSLSEHFVIMICWLMSHSTTAHRPPATKIKRGAAGLPSCYLKSLAPAAWLISAPTLTPRLWFHFPVCARAEKRTLAVLAAEKGLRT